MKKLAQPALRQLEAADLSRVSGGDGTLPLPYAGTLVADGTLPLPYADGTLPIPGSGIAKYANGATVVFKTASGSNTVF